MRVTGNMISGAAQMHKRRPPPLRKTDAMTHAERGNGKLLDEIWRGGGDSFQVENSHLPNFQFHICITGGQSKQKKSAATGSGILCNNNTTVTSNHCSLSPRVSLAPPDYPEQCTSTNDVDTRQRCSEQVQQDSCDSSTFLRLNIGGTFYLLLIDAILRADQSTFLAKFIQLNHMARLKVSDGYLSREAAYYFQRSPLAFEPVFQYYATGVIHRPAELCAQAMAAELECGTRKEPAPDEDERVDDTTFEKLVWGKLRRRMWTFLERPGSSFQAKAFELTSTLFVAVSVMGLSFGTIQDFQITEIVATGKNQSVQMPDGNWTSQEMYVSQRTEHPAFVFTERVCIAFFTVEYCLRMFASPNKLKYALKPLNLVDLLAILPFYLELVLTLCGVDDRKLKDLRWAFLVVRILRVLRVIRIIKLGRFSSGLQTFGMTLQRSQKQLQMMTIVLLTGVVFFSTMIYFLEKDEDGTPFTSIPAAYWWCIVTMTTVGYGDVVPATTMGKIVASAAIMSGVLVLALPITIIVDNFIKVAQDEQQAEQYKEAELQLLSEEQHLLTTNNNNSSKA
uniref:Uncharacterized protein n=1 Tax=Ditylenchus dipsaci TaxID=166011 RepID=A0A915EN19_9BILA